MARKGGAVMTPARQELLRLALEMPEGAVATACRVIRWMCPGMIRPGMPMLGQNKIALLEEMGAIVNDPALRAKFRAALAELKAGYVPAPVPENVVELFPAGQAQPVG
jgi:hypothetical protein